MRHQEADTIRASGRAGQTCQGYTGPTLTGDLNGYESGNYAPDSGTYTFELVDPTGQGDVVTNPDGSYSYSDSSIAHGSVTLYPDGTYSYTPASGYTGEASFAFRLVEDQGGVDVESNLADMVFRLNSSGPCLPSASEGVVTDADGDGSWLPLTPGIAVTAPADTGLVDQQPTLDSPNNPNDTYTASLVDQGPGITASVNSDGGFTIEAASGFTGRSWFTYQLHDGTTGYDSNYATMYVNVAAPTVTTPAAPTNLTAAAMGFQQITLRWTPGDASATSFIIQRQTDGGDFTTLATVDGGQTSYIDSTATPGAADYVYQVIAVNAAGSSDASNQAEIDAVYVSVVKTQDGSVVGAADDIFTISRIGNINEPLTVYYTLAGTAVPGPQDLPAGGHVAARQADYCGAIPDLSAPGVYIAIIPAGHSTVDLIFTPLYNDDDQLSQTIDVQLQAPPAQDPGAPPCYANPETNPGAQLAGTDSATQSTSAQTPLADDAPATRPVAEANQQGPATRPALATDGHGSWGTDSVKIDFSYTMLNTSDAQYNGVRNDMGTQTGPSFFLTVKAKAQGHYPGKLVWIQYTEAQLDGHTYTPAPTPGDPNPNPWKGIDRYPNQTSRMDADPYEFLGAEQDKVNAGHGYNDHVHTLYNTDASDSISIDWASSGGVANWGQYSVLTLVYQEGGKDYRVGSLQWGYSTDANGAVTSFGVRPASAQDIETWKAALSPEYITNRYAGDLQ